MRKQLSLLSTAKTLVVCNFGDLAVPFASSLKLQKRLYEDIVTRASADTLLLLQHPPTYTVGKRGGAKDFNTPVEKLRELGAGVVEVGRGGETTFHGPGQLVAYPVVNLRRLRIGARAFVEGLEDTIIAALGNFGISAQGRQPGRTGVWTEERKIASIGVQISRGVSIHGFALNVATDLSFFDHIVPCGILDKKMTSVQLESAAQATMQEATQAVIESFIEHFGYTSVTNTEAEL